MKGALFISDSHLGYPSFKESKYREVSLVNLLAEYQKKIDYLFLVGDIFDFWFEYKHVVPKGFIRLLGKLAELSDNGIKIYYLGGNHDMWLFDYLKSELNLIFNEDYIDLLINEKKFFISHGDAFNESDKLYMITRKIFKNPISRKIFAFLHPYIGINIAKTWSYLSRINEKHENLYFQGEDKEPLIQYAKNKLINNNYDFIIFGHRHIPCKVKIGEKTTLIIIGDWFKHFSYAFFDGTDIFVYTKK
ncbi:MAG: UDP-2,3-diacylglucosamine diphosphatase [Bacteroidales bacterium]|nr:UDP-2,3-diacylglucosamine diphosphatase [Bacteroidales bacterium]